MTRLNSVETEATANNIDSDLARVPVLTVPPNKFRLCRIAGIFADAFSDYPLLRWTLNNNPSSTRMRFQLFLLLVEEFGSKFGAIQVAEHNTGAAIWMRSSRLPEASEEKCEQIGHSFQDILGVRSTKKLLSINLAMGRYHPSTPHLYLYLIGVRKRYQRHGLGSQLMRAGLEAADNEQKPIFTETSSENVVRFYQRFNFDIVDKYFVARRGPPTWTMLRMPQKRAGSLEQKA